MIFHKGIRRRWLLNSMSIILAAIVVSISTYTVAIGNYYYAALRSGLENQAAPVSSFASRYFTRSYDYYYDSIARYVKEFRDKTELQFIGMSGRVEASNATLSVGTMPNGTDIRECADSGTPKSWTGRDRLSGERVMAVSVPVFAGEYSGTVIGVIRYVTSLHSVDRKIANSCLMAFGIALFFFILVFLTNLYMTGSIIRPIRDLNEIAKKIAAGSYGVRIEKKYDDEIGELCDTINNLSSEIKLAESLKTDFMSSVSHELRTPLTAIAGWSETLLAASDYSAPEVRKGVGIILKETQRLTKLVESLLDFTRLESGRFKLQIEEFDILSDYEEIIYMEMDNLKREGIMLTNDSADDIPDIFGDRARLRQAFLNVLDNAVKHGGGGKRIDCSISYENSMVVMRVRDYGPGIPPDELPHIKYKFYRGSTQARGSGIGLAISDEIVSMHNGTLNIESELGSGTTATIVLPVSPARI